MKFLLSALLLLITISPANAQSAYDRVMKTNTIRCGYGVWSPWIDRNMETNKTEGVIVTIMNRVAEVAGLKTDWAEEVGWGSLPASLFEGRVDVACSTMWNDPQRGRLVAFTDPLFYMPTYAFIRADDARDYSSKEKINSPDVRISYMEGDFSAALANRLFPKAEKISVSQEATNADVFMNVTTGKADVVLADIIMITEFNKNSDVKLSAIKDVPPLSYYGNAVAVSIKEQELLQVMNSAVRYLVQSGEIEDLTAEFLKKYPGALMLLENPSGEKE